MNDLTKHRLKQVNRLLKVGVMTFAWLMACVGVSAYAIYWLRQNQTQEVSPREVTPKRANSNTQYYYYEWDSSVSIGNWVSYSGSINSAGENYYAISLAGGNYYRYDNYLTGDTSQWLCFSVKAQAQSPGSSTFVYYVSEFFQQPSFISFVTGGSLSGNSLIIKSNIDLMSNDFVVTEYANVGAHYNYTINATSIMRGIFKPIYEYKDTTDYNFNEMPNYNQLLTYQLLPNNVYQYNGTNPVTPADITYYVDLTFMANGKLFKGLSFDASAVAFVSDNNGNVTTYDSLWVSSSDTYKLTITGITYWYYGLNTGIEVASLGVLEYRTEYNNISISSTPVWLTLNGFNWINEDYKYISIYNPSKDNPTRCGLGYINTSVCPFLSLTSYDALTFNVSTNIIGSNITDIGLGNAFTLMGNAFNGLAGILAIQVLPGLTLGLLCFVPLIVTIIIVVLRLVKK